ncbi:MAG: F0F1 ATP synthase subunit B [Solirubrobacterales bacterium]
MEINIPKIIAVIINFLLLYFILRHYLFTPVNNAIDKRQNDIVDKINKTDEDLKKAEALRLENESILSGAKDEGKNIVENYKNKAEKLSSDIVQEARTEADDIIKRAKVEAERQIEKSADEMKNQIVDLAVLLSSKALAEAIDEEQHRRLIKDFIVKVGI